MTSNNQIRKILNRKTSLISKTYSFHLIQCLFHFISILHLKNDCSHCNNQQQEPHFPRTSQLLQQPTTGSAFFARSRVVATTKIFKMVISYRKACSSLGVRIIVKCLRNFCVKKLL